MASVSSFRVFRIAFVVLLVAGLPTLPAGAAEPTPEDCPKWFPDFQCDRSGRWEGFRMPIMQPYFFEDPFITTGVYAYHLYHQFPSTGALGRTPGGPNHYAYANALAVQARVAITDRFAFVATKDGFLWERPGNRILEDHEGFMNLGGGFKYALIDDRENDFILSSTIRVEVPTGAKDIFEGGGGGVVWMPSLSAAWGRDKLHVIGDLGGQIRSNSDRKSNMMFTHLYVDYAVAPRFQPWVQLSGMMYFSSGKGTRRVRTTIGRLPLSTVEAIYGDFEGIDVHNFGSTGVTHNNLWFGSVGFHVPINRYVTFSAGYEWPISSRRDIMKQRVVSTLSLEF